MDTTDLTISEASKKLQAGELTAAALTAHYLAKAKADNLNAYLGIFEGALVEAKAVDERRAKGEQLSPLAGVPLAIKDNILVKGEITSSASKMLAEYTASYDATVIAKLKAAGAILIGRTNMDEFAMGGSTENSAFGPVKNPHDTTRVAGGSSGGSAAVVGADLALAALGSDTGGSIRQPAAFCGVVGLKPTYGTVSRSGLTAMASSLDQIGPITKTVADAKLIFDLISGVDPLDSTTTSEPLLPAANRQKIGIPRSFISAGLDAEMVTAFAEAEEKFKKLGYELVDVELPSLKYALACYYIIMPAEVSTNLARLDGLRYGYHAGGKNLLEEYELSRAQGFGPEVRRRIMLGTYVLSSGYYDAYYAKAGAVREMIKADYDRVFAEVDTILTPTTPGPAFKIGEKASDPLTMYLEDIFTVPINLAGLPAISLPAGKTKSGLPLGIQLTGPALGENTLFKLASEFEAQTKL